MQIKHNGYLIKLHHSDFKYHDKNSSTYVALVDLPDDMNPSQVITVEITGKSDVHTYVTTVQRLRKPLTGILSKRLCKYITKESGLHFTECNYIIQFQDFPSTTTFMLIPKPHVDDTDILDYIW